MTTDTAAAGPSAAGAGAGAKPQRRSRAPRTPRTPLTGVHLDPQHRAGLILLTSELALGEPLALSAVIRALLASGLLSLAGGRSVAIGGRNVRLRPTGMRRLLAVLDGAAGAGAGAGTGAGAGAGAT